MPVATAWRVGSDAKEDRCSRWLRAYLCPTVAIEVWGRLLVRVGAGIFRFGVLVPLFVAVSAVCSRHLYSAASEPGPREFKQTGFAAICGKRKAPATAVTAVTRTTA